MAFGSIFTTLPRLVIVKPQGSKELSMKAALYARVSTKHCEACGVTFDKHEGLGHPLNGQDPIMQLRESLSALSTRLRLRRSGALLLCGETMRDCLIMTRRSLRSIVCNGKTTFEQFQFDFSILLQNVI
jgi:hypothetical protein